MPGKWGRTQQQQQPVNSTPITPTAHKSAMGVGFFSVCDLKAATTPSTVQARARVCSTRWYSLAWGLQWGASSWEGRGHCSIADRWPAAARSSQRVDSWRASTSAFTA